ncbi:unnamed protein product, partial [Meganyctiphanes norvegica]
LEMDEVKVTEVNVKSIGHRSKNILDTFFTLQKNHYTEIGCVKQPHLNSDPFLYNLKIVNKKKTDKTVNIRIFLAPIEDENNKKLSLEEQRTLWTIMDRFTVALHPGSNTIKRSSCLSSITVEKPYTLDQIYKQIQRMFNLDSSECNTSKQKCGDHGECSPSCKPNEKEISGDCPG